MSLVEYSYRNSRKSDVQEKITHSVVVITGFGTPFVGWDPTALISVGTIPNGIVYYLMIKGDYQNFLSLPISRTHLTYSPVISMRGTVISLTGALTDAGSVVFIQGNPDNVTVPNGYTLFPFMVTSPINGHSVTPSIGLVIELEIAKYPQYMYNVT